MHYLVKFENKEPSRQGKKNGEKPVLITTIEGAFETEIDASNVADKTCNGNYLIIVTEEDLHQFKGKYLSSLKACLLGGDPSAEVKVAKDKLIPKLWEEIKLKAEIIPQQVDKIVDKTMLDQVNIVKGAITKEKNILLKNICAYDNRIQATNLQLTIDAPFNYDLNFVSPATPFIKALEISNNPTVKLHDKEHKITITDNNFTAKLPLLSQKDFPLKKIENKAVRIEGDLLGLFSILKPFVNNDDFKPWSNGVFIKNGYAYAHNGVTLIRSKFDSNLPKITIPIYIINELLRINKTPKEIVIGENDIIFLLDDGSWIAGQQLTGEWPDDLEKVIEIKDNIDELPENINDIMKKLSFFIDDIYIFLSEDGLSTDEKQTYAKVSGIKFKKSAFNFKNLQAIFKIATHFDSTAYPDLCPFYNKKLSIEGMIAGVAL